MIFGLGLMVPAIIFSADNDETGRGWGRALSEDEFGATDFKSYAPAAFFLGFLILFVVLALVVVMRSGWPQLGFQRVQAWVVAPLYGHATTFVLLPVAGLVAFLLLGFGEPSVTENDPTGDDLQALLTLVFGLLANGGVWVMSLGAGASVGSNTEATDEPDDAEWFHLWGQVTDDEPGLWAAPAIMLAILVASAFVVLRRSPPGHALRSLLIWVGSLLPSSRCSCGSPARISPARHHSSGRTTSSSCISVPTASRRPSSSPEWRSWWQWHWLRCPGTST